MLHYGAEQLSHQLLRYCGAKRGVVLEHGGYALGCFHAVYADVVHGNVYVPEAFLLVLRVAIAEADEEAVAFVEEIFERRIRRLVKISNRFCTVKRQRKYFEDVAVAVAPPHELLAVGYNLVVVLVPANAGGSVHINFNNA